MIKEIESDLDKGKGLDENKLSVIFEDFLSGKIPQEEIVNLLKLITRTDLDYPDVKNFVSSEVNTGIVLDWPEDYQYVDKHSTGGVGDKVSLVVVPWVASTGVKVPKLSGRALGHTGGTIDKLESIPGVKTQLTIEEFKDAVKNIGCAICEPFENLCPVESKLYDLRDRYNLISHIPLITASILSKKISAGADGFVFDVKVGRGAFMKTLKQAELLGTYLKEVSRLFSKETSIIISNMDNPLGYSVGNTLEVLEAIDFLSGKDIPDLKEVVEAVAVKMLEVSGKKRKEAVELLDFNLNSGKALTCFEDMVSNQGGPSSISDIKKRLKRAKIVADYTSDEPGYLFSIDPLSISKAAKKASGNQKRAETGVLLKKKPGDEIEREESLAEVHATDYETLDRALDVLENAFVITSEKTEPGKVVQKII